MNHPTLTNAIGIINAELTAMNRIETWLRTYRCQPVTKACYILNCHQYDDPETQTMRWIAYITPIDSDAQQATGATIQEALITLALRLATANQKETPK